MSFAMKRSVSLFVVILSICWPVVAASQRYNIGPDQEYRDLRDFNWDELNPGDVVQIHHRDEPYREKIVIRRSGTKQQPIVIRGISNGDGELPVIEGDNAVHFQKLCEGDKYSRGVIIVGDCKPGDHLIIEGLEIRGANNRNHFKLNGKVAPYSDNAAGIFLNKGQHVQIKKCALHSCGMGILTSYYPDTDQFYLGHSKIYNNGDFTQTRWGHNVYIGARATLIEFNRFGELYSDGNNIKDRSHTTVIRYNWIEGGMSRQIDLVEHEKYPQANAFVYGNMILHGRRVVNPKMILFGGDLPERDGKGGGSSRSGTLYFFNNTMVSTIETSEPFIYLNRIDCKARIVNNAMIGRKRIWFGEGSATGSNNLLSSGADPEAFTLNYHGGLEQFERNKNNPFIPHGGSLLINHGTHQLPAKVKFMPSAGGEIIKRPLRGAMDIGAFER